MHRKIQLFLILVSLTFAPKFAFAFIQGSKPFASFGVMNENLTRTTDDASGKTSFLGTANDYPLFLGLSIPLLDGASVAPRLGYTLLPREDEDGAVKVEYLIISIPYVRVFGQSMVFDYSIGTSYISQTYKGEGGTISSTNGGSPATFYAGDYDQKAQYMTIDFGLGYNQPPYKFAIDLFVLSAFSDKRSYNLLFNFSYFWSATL
jgi:hypothetical protein